MPAASQSTHTIDARHAGAAGSAVSAAYEQAGYLIVRSIFSGQRLSELRDGADRFVAAVRGMETLRAASRIDLLHPAMVGHHEAGLLDCLCDDAILGLSQQLGHGPLIGTSYYLNIDTPDMYWHQDLNFLPKTLPADFDLATFCGEIPFSQIQWNVALTDDHCLMIVPDSHRRPLTDDEDVVRRQTDDRSIYHDDMPGGTMVELGPGDAVVYNNNLLHAVRNPQRRYRRTLHWFWVRGGHYDPYHYPRTVFTPAECAALDPRLVAMSGRAPPPL